MFSDFDSEDLNEREEGIKTPNRVSFLD